MVEIFLSLIWTILNDQRPMADDNLLHENGIMCTKIQVKGEEEMCDTAES